MSTVTVPAGSTESQINSAMASAGSGGTVNLSAGTYTVSHPIVPISNITMTCPSGVAIIQAASA